MSAKTNEELTPFEKSGYTKDTKFKALKDRFSIKKGTIVTLYKDDGTISPYFKREDGREGVMFLPNMAPGGWEEELEVYGGDK